MGIEIVPNHSISARTPEIMDTDTPGEICALHGDGMEMAMLIVVLLEVGVGGGDVIVMWVMMAGVMVVLVGLVMEVVVEMVEIVNDW